MLFWPGCMQLTFATTSVLSLGQAHLLRRPWIRNWLGIQPIPKAAPASGKPSSPYAGVLNTYQPPEPAKERKGIVGGAIADIKGAAGNAMGRLRKRADDKLKAKSPRLRQREVQQAKIYEERRRREIEMERLERLRAKKEKRLKSIE